MLMLKASAGEEIGVELTPDEAVALAGILQQLAGAPDSVRAGVIVTK